MRDNLYLPLKKFSLRYAYFMIFDVKPYVADQLFIRRKVRAWFDGEYVKADYPYTMVLCHVRKKDPFPYSCNNPGFHFGTGTSGAASSLSDPPGRYSLPRNATGSLPW